MIAKPIKDMLQGLSEQLCSAIDDRGWPEPCLCTVMEGEIVPFDYCDSCSGGMAWVRLVRMSPPDTAVQQNTCATSVNIEVEMGIIRAAPMPDDDNTLPTADEHLDAARHQIDEAEVMFNTLRLMQTPQGERFFNLNYAPIGPDGGCVGGTWTATVALL